MGVIFLNLLNMSITASWLILAVLGIRLLFRRIPKWITCLLWGVVAIRLIFPFSKETVFSLQPRAEPIRTSTMVEGELIPYVPSVDSNIGVVENTINPALAETFAYQETQSVAPLQIVTEIAGGLWLCGMVVLLILALVSMIKLRLCVREAVLYRENIYICDAVKSPFILGIIRPRIYLSSSLSEEEMAYIIAHESAHLKRKDHLWKPFGYLLLCIHWFNPLVWIAYILLCRDIELACDEKVIRELNQNESISYSEALLSCSVNRRTVMVCPLAFGEVGVKERVKNVLNYKKPAFWIVAIAVVASIVLGVCFLTNPSSFPVKLDSVQISKASTMDFRTNSVPTTFQLSAAEIDELSSRIKNLKIGHKDQSLQGHTPFYSLHVDTKENDRITFSGFDSNGNQSAILYENVYYRITDSDIISYIQPNSAPETTTESNLIQQSIMQSWNTTKIDTIKVFLPAKAILYWLRKQIGLQTLSKLRY